MPSAERQDRRIKVIACRPVYTGRNQLGHQYTIYEVDAAREDGRLINEKLRAFQSLPVGQVIEVTIEPFVSQQYGKSFTLHPKEATSADKGEQLNKLVRRLDELVERFKRLEERVVAVEERGQQTESPPHATPSQSW